MRHTRLIRYAYHSRLDGFTSKTFRLRNSIMTIKACSDGWILATVWEMSPRSLYPS